MLLLPHSVFFLSLLPEQLVNVISSLSEKRKANHNFNNVVKYQTYVTKDLTETLFHTWLLDLYYLWARSSCHIWISVKARSWIQKSLTLKGKCWNAVPHMCCSDFFFSVTKCQRRQLKEERIYLGSWFQRFQSVISELHCCDPVERQSVTTEKRESKRRGEADVCSSQSAGKKKRIGTNVPGTQCIFQRHSPRELPS